MNWWQRLRGRRRLEGHLQKELRFHLDQHTKDLVASGLDPREARIHLGTDRNWRAHSEQHNIQLMDHLRHENAAASNVPVSPPTTFGNNRVRYIAVPLDNGALDLADPSVLH